MISKNKLKSAVQDPVHIMSFHIQKINKRGGAGKNKFGKQSRKVLM